MIVTKLEVEPPSGRMAMEIILAVVFISLEAFVFWLPYTTTSLWFGTNRCLEIKGRGNLNNYLSEHECTIIWFLTTLLEFKNSSVVF